MRGNKTARGHKFYLERLAKDVMTAQCQICTYLEVNLLKIPGIGFSAVASISIVL